MKNILPIQGCLLLAGLLATSLAPAATITWTNLNSGNWNLAENWEPNLVPGSADSASIPGGVNVFVDATNSAGALNLGAASALTILSNGVLNLYGGATIYAPLTNFGTVNWLGGEVRVYGGAWTGTVWNQAGGLWNAQCDQLTWGASTSVEEFHNAGTVCKSIATGTTAFGLVFDNTGVVLAQSGTITISSPHRKTFLGGTFQADAAGVINFNGYLALSNAPSVQGPGSVYFNVDVLLDNLQGALSLTGGNVSGRIATNGVLNILNGVRIYSPLTNSGTVNWLGGEVRVYAGSGADTGEIWNATDGLWNAQCDQLMWGASTGVEEFHNAGMVRKSVATGTTTFGLVFDNTGVVQAQSGTITISSPHRKTFLGGTFQADVAGAINFNGYLALSNAPSVQGPGSVYFNVDVLLDNLQGALSLTGGNVSGRIATNGVLNLLGGISIFTSLTNAGTVNWLGGEVRVWAGGVFTGTVWNEAGGLWSIQCDQLMSAAYSGTEQFHNAGMVRKSVATGNTTFNLFFDNTGAVQAQTGVIAFSVYSSSSLAELAFSLGGTSPENEFGRITFSSKPSLGGTFTVTTRNGFRPNPGDSFALLNYPGAGGDFASLEGLDLGAGLRLEPNFKATGLTLTAVNYTTNAFPELSLRRSANGVFLNWPVVFTGWELRSTTNLDAPVWASVPLAGTNNSIVPRNLPEQFFRLNKTN